MHASKTNKRTKEVHIDISGSIDLLYEIVIKIYLITFLNNFTHYILINERKFEILDSIDGN